MAPGDGTRPFVVEGPGVVPDARTRLPVVVIGADLAALVEEGRIELVSGWEPLAAGA